MKLQAKILIILGVILILLINADVISTDIALSIPGMEEANPNSRRIIETSGMAGLYLSSIWLWIGAAAFPFAYVMSSKAFDYLAKKGMSQKSFIFLDLFVFCFCLSFLLFLIAQRVIVVANNIYWITSSS